MTVRNHTEGLRPLVLLMGTALAALGTQASAETIGQGGANQDSPVILDGNAYEVGTNVQGYFEFSNADGVTINGGLKNQSDVGIKSKGDLTLNAGNNQIIAKVSNIRISSAKNLTITSEKGSAIRAQEGGNIELTAEETITITSSKNAVLYPEADSSINLVAKKIEMKGETGTNFIQPTGNGSISATAQQRIDITGDISAKSTPINGQTTVSESATVTLNAPIISIIGAIEASTASKISLTAQDSASIGSISISDGGYFNSDTPSLILNNGIDINNNGNISDHLTSTFEHICADGSLTIYGSNKTDGYSIEMGNSGGFKTTAQVETGKVYIQHGIKVKKTISSLNFSATDNLKISAADSGMALELADGTIRLTSLGTAEINGDIAADGPSGVLSVSTSGELHLTGNVGTTSASVTLGGGSDSVFQGSTARKGGTLDLTLGSGSVWNLTDSSDLTSLTMSDGRLDFGFSNGSSVRNAPEYRSLTTDRLSGSGNTLLMRIDLGKETADNVLTDQLIVTESATGKHTADIRIDGRDMADAASKFRSVNWLVSQGAGSDLTILNQEGTNEFTGNGMVTTWALGFVADGDEAKLDTPEGLREIASATTGTESGKWYLVRTDESLPDPQPDPDPDPDPDPKPEDPGEMQTLTNLGISATQALSFAAELEDLRTRLGEIRYGAQEGAWVKAGYAKERAEGFRGRGFEQKTTDLHIGLDRLVAEDESSAWLVGGALRYAESDQEGFAAAAGGDGTLEQYSAKLYAAYMHESGSYADFVLQAGRYDQEVKGLANDKTGAFRADYTGYGFGAGVEVGHMFAFNETVDDRRWFDHAFFEPQLQLTYFRAQGKDYRTTTGMKVSQGDADFLTGRAGFVLGKKFGFGSAESLDRRFFQAGLKGGVKYEFLGDQTVRFTGVEGVTKKRDAEAFDGARWYYGITADWQMSEDFRAYANLEREEGDRYTKDFDVSVGVKYLF